jgi:UDP-N-acetyl-D-mannosaminuronic acid dehydrogenase
MSKSQRTTPLHKKKTICVVGLGYMGLPTAALFATHGYDVIGYDIDKRKIEALEQKNVYLDEPGLKELVTQALDQKTLHPTNKITKADVYIIAVPTPIHEIAKRSELRYVILAAGAIAGILKPGDLVILESTVPPRTTEKLVIPILESSGLEAGKDFLVSHCPERAIPGNTLYELINNDRVIGAFDDQSARQTEDLYHSFSKGTIHLTDLTTAETVKLMENTFRDINIALANEFAKVSEEIGISAWEAIALANKHPRVNILQPGPGVGGHCIAVDPWFLTEETLDAKIIRTAREINDSMPDHVAKQAQKLLDGVAHPEVAVLGVAYKANVDDSRETPAEHIIRLGLAKGWQMRAHDPHVQYFSSHPLTSLEDTLRGADLAILVTNHENYRALDPQTIKKLMRRPVLLDTRNHLDHRAWHQAGFTISVLGNGKRTHHHLDQS